MLQSVPVPQLTNCDRQILYHYFEDAWELEEILFKSLVQEETFYLNPDPLRNRLIFYLGHSAVFYINKLIRVGLLKQRINPEYEILFEIGVDPETPEELETEIKDISWPSVEDVWQYRHRARDEITSVINQTDLNLPIASQHPLWALMMGTEHSRIHFETSSMLLRQLSVERLERPSVWRYAPSESKIYQNKMLLVPGGVAKLGKSRQDTTYGWDNEYGTLQATVKPFFASKYLISNQEFLEFVKDRGYHNPEFWDDQSWTWLQNHQIQHPKFWILNKAGYQYRAMFDVIDLPLNWPVEVNYYEAMAYCAWKGQNIRLMTEAEWQVASAHCQEEQNFNLHVKFGSPCPVGTLPNADQASGLYDIRGNVWEWLSDDFTPLPGFKPHRLYEDYSAPFFDVNHKVMRGGAWASTGAYASVSCRNWFRRNFYQHVGFRIARDYD
ncbi:MAG: 5-histidylcysteine sulfoxide synthase [Cyanobacteria bacterium J06621_8]